MRYLNMKLFSIKKFAKCVESQGTHILSWFYIRFFGVFAHTGTSFVHKYVCRRNICNVNNNNILNEPCLLRRRQNKLPLRSCHDIIWKYV